MKFKHSTGSVQEISVFHWSAGSLNVYLTNAIGTYIILFYSEVKSSII
jgi:hypothetical protein